MIFHADINRINIVGQRLESELLRTFIAVAETESFTAAGTAIGRTQSAISVQMKKLEHLVGRELFDRRSYGMTLTRDGRALEEHARSVVALLDASPEVMARTSLEGTVRLGIPEEYGVRVLTEALAEFKKQQPKVEILIRCVSSNSQLKALISEHLDLAVVFEPEGRTVGALLAEDPTVWVGTSEHRLEIQDPVPVAIHSLSTWSQNVALRSLENCGIAYRVAFVSDTLGGYLLALKAGLAIAPLSKSSIPIGFRELTSVGFPQIDIWQVTLHRNPQSQSYAIDGMILALQKAFRNPLTPPA